VSVLPGNEADLVISSIADVPKLAGGLLELVSLDAA
jgi:flagellar basal body P-ring protein FlgI